MGQEQNQSQAINIANDEHGMTDYVNCIYYWSEHVAFLKKTLSHGERKEETERGKLYDQVRRVKILIYKGKTKEVYCPHLRGNKCNSPIESKEEQCWLVKQDDSRV